MQDVKSERWKYIGGSDIPIILGISPFRTRWELLQEKARIKESDFDGNIFTNYGNEMEPKIRDHINSLGYGFEEHKIIDGVFRYHADGYDEKSNMVLEIKTTGEFTEAKKRVYLAQLLWGMQMYDSEAGILAVYKRPDDLDTEFDKSRLMIFDVYREAHKAYLSDINYLVDRFVDDMHKLRENPKLSQMDIIPQKVADIARAIEKMEAEITELEDAKSQYDDLKAQLKKAMEQFMIKSWETPSGMKITLVPDGEAKSSWVFNIDRFAEENPDIYKKYLEKTTKAGRKGYVRITHEK